MNKAIQTARRTQLFQLIVRVGLHYKEDIDWLRKYARDIVAKYNTDKAIICFRDLAEQIRYSKPTEG